MTATVEPGMGCDLAILANDLTRAHAQIIEQIERLEGKLKAAYMTHDNALNQYAAGADRDGRRLNAAAARVRDFDARCTAAFDLLVEIEWAALELELDLAKKLKNWMSRLPKTAGSEPARRSRFIQPSDGDPQ